jgi:hypothetical protein
MYQSGLLELQSNGWMQISIGDRVGFEAVVSRGFSSQSYHTLFTPKEILCLQRVNGKRIIDDTKTRAMSAGAAVGRLMCDL